MQLSKETGFSVKELLHDISWKFLLVLFDIHSHLQFDTMAMSLAMKNMTLEGLENLKLSLKDPTDEPVEKRKLDVREYEKIPGVKWSKT